MIVTWYSVLQRINLSSKQIQSSTIHLLSIVLLYNTLFDFIQYVRENVEVYESEFYTVLDTQYYKHNWVSKVPRSKNLNNTNFEERQQNLRQNFINDTYYIICDTLLVKIQKSEEKLILK